MNTEQQDYLWRKIKGIKVGMLTSRDGAMLRSRPMYLTQKEFAGSLWFFSHADSHKTEEVNALSDVNVSFMDIDADEYVSVSGEARLVKDQAIINDLWNPMVAAWFPEGKDSGSVLLLEVEVRAAEVWDAHEGKMKQMIDVMKAKAKHRTPDIGENVKLS